MRDSMRDSMSARDAPNSCESIGRSMVTTSSVEEEEGLATPLLLSSEVMSSASTHLDLSSVSGMENLPNYFSDQVSYWVTARSKVVVAMIIWYLLGVLTIVTTKVLVNEWNVPPLLLTFQQVFVGSTMLRGYLLCTEKGLEPWPWNHKNESATTAKDFVLIGLFNTLDFLASNTAFSRSAASFVETIKASDPITTTAVALIWKVDRLGSAEACNLVLLIAGMFLSTVGNSQSEGNSQQSVNDSVFTAVIVVTANICFAFRALSQKMYRQAAIDAMDDASLLCRMQQIGSVILFFPALFCYTSELMFGFSEPSIETQLQYIYLALVNAFGFFSYNLAACFLLSKITVTHYAALSCLRRMFAIIASCIVFRIEVNAVMGGGILTSFGGFCGFTYYRSMRQKEEKTAP
jgi:drug/metabolite transporter (DMT)-like permease